MDYELPEHYKLDVAAGCVVLSYKRPGLFAPAKVVAEYHPDHQAEQDWTIRKAVRHAWIRENPLIDFEDDNEW